MKYNLMIESQWNMPYPVWKCLTYTVVRNLPIVYTDYTYEIFL